MIFEQMKQYAIEWVGGRYNHTHSITIATIKSFIWKKYEGCSESNTYYFIIYPHNIRGEHGSIVLPIIHNLLCFITDSSNNTWYECGHKAEICQ